jgi:hypothetical protein
MKRTRSATKKEESLFKTQPVIHTICRTPSPFIFAKLLRLSKVIRSHVWHFLIDPTLHDIHWYESFVTRLYSCPPPLFPLDEAFMDSHPVFYPDNPILPRAFRLGKIIRTSIVKAIIPSLIKLQVNTVGYLRPGQFPHIKHMVYTCESSPLIGINVCREWYFVALGLSIAMDMRVIVSNINRTKQPITLNKDINLLI